MTLSLNLENWNFLPPRATLLSIDLRRALSHNEIPETVEDPQHHVNHITTYENVPGVWFCLPGFFEYHEYYGDVDRWELIKNTDEGKILHIVNQACNKIDRTKLN